MGAAAWQRDQIRLTQHPAPTVASARVCVAIAVPLELWVTLCAPVVGAAGQGQRQGRGRRSSCLGSQHPCALLAFSSIERDSRSLPHEIVQGQAGWVAQAAGSLAGMLTAPGRPAGPSSSDTAPLQAGVCRWVRGRPCAWQGSGRSHVSGASGGAASAARAASSPGARPPSPGSSGTSSGLA